MMMCCNLIEAHELEKSLGKEEIPWGQTARKHHILLFQISRKPMWDRARFCCGGSLGLCPPQVLNIG